MALGKVYKIIHSQSDIVYIGSTINRLSDRWRNHKKLNSNCVINKYIQQYGAEQFKIVLIKEYEVVDRTHLEAYEQLWINKTKCVNYQSAFKIQKFYYLHNLQKYKETNDEYYKNNKNILKEKRNEKKDKINDYQKIYRNEKRIRINCECGGKYYEINKLAHFKTKKHQNFIS